MHMKRKKEKKTKKEKRKKWSRVADSNDDDISADRIPRWSPGHPPRRRFCINCSRRLPGRYSILLRPEGLEQLNAEQSDSPSTPYNPRAGPSVPMPPSARPLPPSIFRFQPVKKARGSISSALNTPTTTPSPSATPSIPMKPLSQQKPPVPAAPPARQTIPYAKNNHRPQNRSQPASRTPNNFTTPQPQTNQQRATIFQNNGPSTSYAGPSTSTPSTSNAPRHVPRKPQPTSSGATTNNNQIFEKEKGEEDEEKKAMTYELPPNCKLFTYKCVVGGVERTLLVPMPMNATEEDLKKMLPDSFSEMAEKIFEAERAQKEPSEQVVTLTFPDGTSPTIELLGNEGTPAKHEKTDPPILVNPKQFQRIQKRRKMRQRLEMSGRLPLQRQKYLHESRHLHAIKRKRGIDGRFDTKNAPDNEGQSSSGTRQVVQFAVPMPRQVTTYAEIRPANEIYENPSANRNAQPYYTPGQRNHNTSNYLDYQNEPITSYQQYQHHLQYADREREFLNHREDVNQESGAGSSTTDEQKFTNL
ncbi:unnamed protein product [Caenorhabditis sp. 36 PRJEB53466]|nr:unnamed protein product [Caenorhabditis sp. 36 PRJEB53466]